jgi:NAD(P)-dependent dehydrogenase (short-subunit alcohol dehydrogenase family)
MSGHETAAVGKPKLKPLNEQVMVITGASSGIGLATARAAAKAGATVVVASRNAEAVETLAREIRDAGGRALGALCDVTEESDVRRLAETVIAQYGGFDTWVNNAGVSIYGLIEEVETEDMKQLFETNFWGVVHGSRAALEHLKVRGGAIINVGSTLSERVIPLQGIYCASKFAVRGFTDALRMEVEKAGYPVAVTLVKPAAIDTPYVRHAKNYLPEEPQNPPPVYAPEVVVEVILHCATHAERDMFAGGAGALFGWMEKFMPRATDRAMEATLFDIQQKHGEDAEPRGNAGLYQPGVPVLRERGEYDGPVVPVSPYNKMKMHREAIGLAAVGAGLLAFALVGAARRGANGAG